MAGARLGVVGAVALDVGSRMEGESTDLDIRMYPYGFERFFATNFWIFVRRECEVTRTVPAKCSRCYLLWFDMRGVPVCWKSNTGCWFRLGCDAREQAASSR